MDPKNELTEFLKDIREKTGVAVSTDPPAGGATGFTVEWRGTPLSLYLAGEGESARRDAKLLAYFLAGSTPARTGLAAVLEGEGGPANAIRYLMREGMEDRPCCAVLVIPAKRHGEVYDHIERCLDGDDRMVKTEEGIAVVHFLSEGQSDCEFGEFLSMSLYEETGVRADIGIGGTGMFRDIAKSYRQASAALRMGAFFRREGEVHAYREYLMVQLVEELSQEKLQEYLTQFCGKEFLEILADETLVNTAEAFLENSLNVSETSRALFMHRNTLVYRLDKIENASGLDIRKFSDAATFRIIIIIYRLWQEREKGSWEQRKTSKK